MQKLYHYTTITSLEAILKNKTLRFNNLTAMDDPEEAVSAEYVNAGRWVFTSSWTRLRDNKLMFQNYGNNGKGVCLGLINYPFFTRFGLYIKNNKQYMNTNMSMEPFNYTEGIEKYNEKYNFIFAPSVVEEFAVSYSDNTKLIYPQLSHKENGRESYYDGDLGKVKNTKWAYQHEIRYRLRPTIVNLHSVKDYIEFNAMMLASMEGKKYGPAPITNIDIPVNLNSMEVILGSNIEQNDKEKIVKLISKYAPSALISNSSVVW